MPNSFTSSYILSRESAIKTDGAYQGHQILQSELDRALSLIDKPASSTISVSA